MRMVKVRQDMLTLENCREVLVSERSPAYGAVATADHQNCLARFLKSSQNGMEYKNWKIICKYRQPHQA